MKTILSVSVLFLFLGTGCAPLMDLTTEDPQDAVVLSDTIQYVLYYDSIYSKTGVVPLYAWEEQKGNALVLDTSRVSPIVIDTSYIPYFAYSPSTSFRSVVQTVYPVTVDTIYISHPNPIDTCYLIPKYENGMPQYVFDTITVPLAPDGVNPFLKRHPPRITNRDELIAVFGTLREGYRSIESIEVEHIQNGGVSLEVINTMPFQTDSPYNCGLPTERLMYIKPGTLETSEMIACWHQAEYNYKKSSDPLAFESNYEQGTLMKWVFNPTQEHAGNSYIWGVAVTNRAGAGDTLWFDTYIVPFDSVVWE